MKKKRATITKFMTVSTRFKRMIDLACDYKIITEAFFFSIYKFNHNIFPLKAF